ncbi:MAG: hypothetical protein ABR541_02325 [Candidatus Dormibacteria bacterium]
MSNTTFLARATAILFLICAVALFTTRDHNAYWAPLFAAAFAGIVAATVIGLVARRRGTTTTSGSDSASSSSRSFGA